MTSPAIAQTRTVMERGSSSARIEDRSWQGNESR